MPKRIYVAVDLEQRTPGVVALGRLLQEAARAPVVLVTVFPHDPLRSPNDPDMVALREEAQSTLLEFGRSVGLDPADARVIAGNFAARELQRLSEEPDAGVLVVGSTTRGAVGRLLIGGVGQRLLSGAACPVAIATCGFAERDPRAPVRIGVGFDASEESQRALEAAGALARASGASLRIVTAYQRVAFGALAAGALESENVNAAVRRDLLALHTAAVERLRDEGVDVDGRFVDGQPAKVLADESEDLDLLVAGSRGYGPKLAVLLGSATATLAQSAGCPLLLIPRGTAFDLLG